NICMSHNYVAHSSPTLRSSDLERSPARVAARAGDVHPSEKDHVPPWDAPSIARVQPWTGRAEPPLAGGAGALGTPLLMVCRDLRSEEHTSELQSRENLVCRRLL